MVRYRMKVYIKLLIAILVIISISIFYLYSTSPNHVVVDETGQTIGIQNKARETLQGNKFWKDQVYQVEKALGFAILAPQRQTQWDQKMQKTQEKTDNLMNEMYAKYPALRPKPSEMLREAADRKKAEEDEQFLEDLRLKYIARMQKTLPIVKAKAR
jgi:hypothetical protein